MDSGSDRRPETPNLKRNLTSGSGATFSRAKHPGRNLYMLPGGVAEIFTAQPARCAWLCAEGRSFATHAGLTQ